MHALADHELIVPRLSFEGLLRALADSPDHRQALRAAGFDAEAPRDAYPADLWRRVLEISREHAYPDLPSAEGFRQLGLRCVPAFAQSALGRVVSVSLKDLPPEGFLRRMPTFLPFGRPGVAVDIWAEAERRWRARVTDPAGVPDF